MASEENEDSVVKPDHIVIEISNINLNGEIENHITGPLDTKVPISEDNTLTIVEPVPETNDGDFITKIRKIIFPWWKRNAKWIKYITLAIIFILYNTYLGFSIYKTWNSPPLWNRGIRSLVVMTSIVYFLILYYVFLKKYIIKPFLFGIYSIKYVNKVMNWYYFPWIIWSIIVLSALTYVVIDSANNRYRLLSFFGLFVLVLFGYLFSAHRRHIIWRQTLWGILLQFAFGLIVFKWEIGRMFLKTFAEKVDTFLGYTDYGSAFVFDYLATGMLTGKLTSFNDSVHSYLNSPDRYENLIGQNVTLTLTHNGIFAFKVLPVILFFSFFTSILYYYGIMQIVVIKIGWFLHKTIRTTACESVTASANIFLGLTETPLLIKPFIGIMTKSEIHAVMTGGFATIAGGVMAAYIHFGISASHLLSASVMSAPAALSFSKLFYPETEKSRTSIKDIKIEKGSEKNVLEAAVNGVTSAVSIIVNMGSNMVAFLAFIAFMNGTISWLSSLLGYEYIDFNWIIGKCFIPISLIMGVEWEDCDEVAYLVGIKTIVNEFVAYKKLADFKMQEKISKRSEYIATYALCGFSNISAIGIQMGGLVAIAENRKSDLASVSVRALIAGSVACFMTACIAGSLL